MQEALDLGARFRTITSTVPTIPFDAGNVRSVELPRSFLYRNIACRLTGTVNSGGAGAYTVNPEAPLGLIRKLELVADGRKILWTASARDLFRLAHIFRGAEMELGRPIATANQANAFSCSFIVDNNAIRMQLPADSLFDPREYEKIELRVTWGTFLDIVNAGTAPVIAATTALDVQVQQTTVGVEHVAFNRVIQFDEQTVTATSSNFTFNVPRSGLLAGILLRAEHQPTASVPTPTDVLINFVTLKSDNSFNHVDRASWNTLKARNVGEFQMLRAVPDSVTGLSVPTQTAPVTGFTPGYAYLDLTEDGLMTSCLNTLALNVLQLILDVSIATLTAPIQIRATYVFFEPIRPLTSG
jgi:hypothetical protein